MNQTIILDLGENTILVQDKDGFQLCCLVIILEDDTVEVTKINLGVDE